MKNIFLALTIAFLTISACDSTKSPIKTAGSLEGTWQLNYITGQRIAFDGLYSNKKPTIAFDLKEYKVSGNNSCNQYFGTLLVDGNQINFKDAKMGMTMMTCQGEGQNVYMKTLEHIDSYSISEDGKILNFMMGGIAILRFEKLLIDSHNSKNSLEWLGTYRGTTPCADCEGIDSQITLNNDFTFAIKTKYIGKGDAKVFEEKGSFTWDKAGGSILLQGIKEGPSQYKVGENKLIKLDMDGKTTTGQLAEKYVLLKE